MNTKEALNIIEQVATAALKAGLFATLGDAALCENAITYLKTITDAEILRNTGSSDQSHTSSRRVNTARKEGSKKKKEEPAGNGSGTGTGKGDGDAIEAMQQVFPGIQFPGK